MKAKKVKLTDILPPPVDLRRMQEKKALEELRDSIERQGLIVPIVLRKKDDKYELVAGLRRFLCCDSLGWDKIDAVIQDYTDEQAAAVRLVENAQREDVNPLDLAHYIEWCISEFGWLQQDVAEHVGKSGAWVSQHLKLLTLDEHTKELVATGALSARAGYHLTKIEEEEKRKLWADHFVTYEFTVPKIERAITEELEEERREAHPELRPPVDHVTQPMDRPRERCFACGRGYPEVGLLARLVCGACEDAIQRAVAMEQEKQG